MTGARLAPAAESFEVVNVFGIVKAVVVSERFCGWGQPRSVHWPHLPTGEIEHEDDDEDEKE